MTNVFRFKAFKGNLIVPECVESRRENRGHGDQNQGQRVGNARHFVTRVRLHQEQGEVRPPADNDHEQDEGCKKKVMNEYFLIGAFNTACHQALINSPRKYGLVVKPNIWSGGEN